MDRGETDDNAALTAERERLQREIDSLLDLVASGVSPDTLAAKIREREAKITTLDRQLRRRPRQAPPNIAVAGSADATGSRGRQELRAEPDVARMGIKRLAGPLTLLIRMKNRRRSGSNGSKSNACTT